MKRTLLTSTVLIPLGFAIFNGCGDVDETQGTGTTGTNAGGDKTSGGTSGTNNGSSGDTGSSGSMNPAGTGGDMNPAGVGGMGGSGVGGMAGSGMGGTAGSAAGAAGAGGSAGPPVGEGKSNLGFAWKDSWFITGCAQKQGHDCVTVINKPCPARPPSGFEDSGALTRELFPIGGTAGTTYAVSFKFNGLTEGKYYSGGRFAQKGVDVVTPVADAMYAPAIVEQGVSDDTFYIGGTANETTYNVLRMRVLDSAKMEKARYYMNAYFVNNGAESHRTFLVSYAHTIDVPGGGFIEYTVEDSNCRAIDNCGAGPVGEQATCPAGRNVPNEAALVLPTMYNDPGQSTFAAGAFGEKMVPTGMLNVENGLMQPWHSQLNHLTITKVAAK